MTMFNSFLYVYQRVYIIINQFKAVKGHNCAMLHVLADGFLNHQKGETWMFEGGHKSQSHGDQ